MRSDTVKKGVHRAPHRSLLKATGQITDDRDFDKPFIAICNSYLDIIPGHVHLQTVGEYVETQQQSEILRRLGVDFGQGFLFGKPEPLDSTMATLVERESADRQEVFDVG